ncbi:MAG: GAF domain-containing protein [Chloroflexi bacterium]|nr:GAF domain-containing protein [Chloroflexota bacterium]
MEHKETVLARHSIRTKLLILLIGLTSATLLISGHFGVQTLYEVTEKAQVASKTVLTEQANDFIEQIVEKTALQNNAALNLVQQDARYLAFYASDIYTNADDFLANAQWKADKNMRVGTDGQFINSASDIVSVYIPNTVVIDDKVISNLELSSYLDIAFQSIFDNSENITAIYLGTEDDITRYYPNINLGALLPPDFEVSQRPWYTKAVEDNSENNVVWSEVYEDATGQGLLVTASIPVYSNRKLVGVIGIDISLDAIQETLQGAQGLENTYTFLIDESGYPIVLPEQGYLDIFDQPANSFEVTPSLKNNAFNFDVVITAMLSGKKGREEIKTDNGTFFVLYAPLESTGWSIATVVPEKELLQSLENLEEDIATDTQQLIFSRLITTGLILFVIAVILSIWATNQIVSPIKGLVKAVRGLGAENLEFPMPNAQKDEVGILAKTFYDVTSRLRNTMNSLEKRVDERTEALENRAVQLQAAAQVAHDALVFQNVNELLEHATRLISEKFSYYHAGIFLLDGNKEYAVLQAASSEGGQKMLKRGHQLRVGLEGIVGASAREKRPHIALDVGTDAVFFNNPDLPETHSEMALPLLAQNEVIGVLDIQSKESEAFSQQDIEIFQTLANQLALAIQNARLIEETQISLLQLELLSTENAKKAWTERLGKENHGFLYTPLGVKKIKAREPLTSGENEESASIPIALRGKKIGNISLKRIARQWTKKEEALISDIANQVALAIENARLVDETQEQATREQISAEFSTKLRETLDMDTVVKTAIVELKKTFDLDEVEIRLNPSNKENKS